MIYHAPRIFLFLRTPHPALRNEMVRKLHSALRIPHSAREWGQGTLEYAVVLAAVSAALLAMQIYVKRGIAGELRRAADSTGEQYDPKNTTGTITLASTNDATTTSETLNEPQMTDRLKKECLKEGRPPAECAQICQDLSVPPNGNCTDERVFGTISKSILKEETVTRTGDETVGPLGTDLWQ